MDKTTHTEKTEETDPMWVVVYHPSGTDQGLVMLARELADDEVLDALRFADEAAAQWDARVIPAYPGVIGSESGDLRVEFLTDAPELEPCDCCRFNRYTSPVCIYDGESFYCEPEPS